MMAGCSGSGMSGRGSDVDSIYQWENIRKYILQEPDRAFAMVDTAQIWGVADVNYANWMRAQIHLAKGSAHLLATTKDSVSLIAELCGLSRPTFYRLFSETYGMSPSDYRRVAKK